ncbi:hypothetical protein ON010_g1928 [Phytophthora cinnamomi]|nr:hypothetical protein ON010_g1928 [Phytophthora cinnamomi]
MISPLKDIVIATVLGVAAGSVWNNFKDGEMDRISRFYKCAAPAEPLETMAYHAAVRALRAGGGGAGVDQAAEPAARGARGRVSVRALRAALLLLGLQRQVPLAVGARPLQPRRVRGVQPERGVSASSAVSGRVRGQPGVWRPQPAAQQRPDVRVRARGGAPRAAAAERRGRRGIPAGRWRDEDCGVCATLNLLIAETGGACSIQTPRYAV